MGVKSYKDLTIWTKGIEIVNKIYKITREYPKEELFGLVTQMRRSGISIPSNIAEGFVRQHNKEYKQFLYVALGSCAELETQVMISFNQGFLAKDIKETILEEIDHESRMLMNMIKAISRSLPN